ncbi:MAG: vWA domain-containing protein, partial [Planctomycetota bacterium]
MIFPAPIFLYLLPLAGLPIVFHFVLKQKKRTVVFSTLMFFHRTDPKLNSHRKIRQWLLLLLRILLIVFILLALSRPIFQSSAGTLGGKISVVAVVDNSGSMSDGAGYDNDKTKLECAVTAARRLISTLEGGSEAAVVLLVDDPALEPAEVQSDRNPALVGDRLTTDRESLLALLDRIRPTQATGDAGRALARAFGLLRASTAGGGAVHVFSDLQQAEWGTDSKRLEAGGAPITIFVHKFEPEIRDEANVAITAIQLPEERILPQHTYSIGLVLQNTSDTVANIRVNSIDSQDSKNTENVTLARGRTETVEVETRPDENGYHWIKVWIEGDGFSADNEAGVGIFCEETATILFGGTPEEFGVLPAALSPSGQGQFTGMVAEFRSPGQLSQTAAEEKPIMIVATWTGLQLMGESSVPLREYVEAGGNLLVVPSVTVGRRVVSEQLPDWLGAGIKGREVYPGGAALEVLDDRTTFWHRIRDASAGSRLEPVSVYVFHPLGLNEEFTPLEIPETGVKPQKGRFLTGFTPLLGIDSEKVVIAHKQLGQGNIYVSGTAFAPQWNTLP